MRKKVNKTERDGHIREKNWGEEGGSKKAGRLCEKVDLKGEGKKEPAIERDGQREIVPGSKKMSSLSY